jgi:hypothetical protein
MSCGAAGGQQVPHRACARFGMTRLFFVME